MTEERYAPEEDAPQDQPIPAPEVPEAPDTGADEPDDDDDEKQDQQAG